MTPLHPTFLTLPLAHRGLHDRAKGRVENSRAAVRAAVEAGYGIEVDIQPSADGVPMVFHDYDLARLTGAQGFIKSKTAAELGEITLTDGGETIPTLAEILEIVAGQVPLLLEVKDQDGTLGPAIGALEEAIGRVIAGYDGPLALMSFNPNSVRVLGGIAPDVPRGLVTDPFRKDYWPMVPPQRRARLALIPDALPLGVSFISHNRAFLDAAPVAALKARGLSILCWTVRSAQEDAAARRIADNVTFEGYLPG
ncbi:glycerophosphoryl diester phosphodiesterase [Rubricella aquisinus]|uniref:Glycerophosphoryl diester phosphodiesterase n=1 Tax=Rubricella aquisinus TaxID=2028108 RepID=A0A840WTJ4_9RHOB|nr:glycerophosphodiester phosphodiesterase family protein [Rubricella aquisinus]MBB5517002.1 glycerophosphoryl diester phosphodiesterase [Rubricella aquisinus]